MPERRLFIDLGSSRLKWVWAKGPELERSSLGRGELKDFEHALRDPAAPVPDTVWIASVAAPERTSQLARLCEQLWGMAPELMESRAEEGGLYNVYSDASRLGVDRWLALLAAVRHHGKPVIAWDLGTATTLDAVDEAGRHLGGWILPGPGSMLSALGAGTRLAVPDQLGDGPVEPGRDTAHAISGGVLAAQLGALDRFCSAVAPRMARPPRIVATGGAAERVGSLYPGAMLDPWLVFRGMLIRVEKNYM